jgi:hypothetical protein
MHQPASPTHRVHGRAGRGFMHQSARTGAIVVRWTVSELGFGVTFTGVRLSHFPHYRFPPKTSPGLQRGHSFRGFGRRPFPRNQATNQKFLCPRGLITRFA